MTKLLNENFEFNKNVYIESNIKSKLYDGVILVIYPDSIAVKNPLGIDSFIEKVHKVDQNIYKDATVWSCDLVAGDRIVLSPTKEISKYDDSRSLYRAAKNGIERGLKAGIKKPLLIVQNIQEFPNSELILLLGAFEGLYVPLQVREQVPKKSKKIERLGVYTNEENKDLETIIRNAVALERSRTVARDIGSGDPERMTPKNVFEYVASEFSEDSNINVTSISDYDQIMKEYPLLAAVSRAANQIRRHAPVVVKLEYVPEDEKAVTETILLVGKGVTFDTGGADLKINFALAGMSCDKCGAAAVAGFLKACALLKPTHLKVVGILCLTRNSIGTDAYLPDELITSRSGKRVRIVNTDAEGRLAMADALFEMKERARQEINPHLYTIATLTGHVRRTFGLGYSAAMDNHVARAVNHSYKLQTSGSGIADAIDVSLLRPDDFQANRGSCEGDDVSHLDLKNRVGIDSRGHQVGAGFLIIVGGLEDADVKYTHLDIAASAGSIPDQITAAPILALCHLHNVFKS